MNRLTILGVDFDHVTMEEAADRALAMLSERSGGYVCTPNPEIVMAAQRDPELMNALNAADLVLPDGVGVVWAAKKLGSPMPGRVAGYDFLLSVLSKMTGSVYILGGRPGVAESALDAVVRQFPRITAAGSCDGFIRDELALIAEIGEKRPELLIVCLGSPKQELWMAAHRDLPVGLMAGLGGSVDVLAGKASRAPLWWREHGLEWLYRLIREPRRIRRQICLPVYVVKVYLQRMKQWKKAN